MRLNQLLIDNLWEDRKAIQMVEVTPVVTRKSRDPVRDAKGLGFSLKPMDAIHLATAMLYGATEFDTYDNGLTKYAPAVGMPIREPVLAQPTLGFS